MRDADSPRARDSANVTTSETTPARAPKRAHPTAGWLELERALRVVYGGVVRELAPLGVVGMATFDPMAGFVLWSEQREAERDRTRTMRELYPNETMKPESPGEIELASLRVAVKYAIGAYGTASSVLSDASFRDKLKSLKAAGGGGETRGMGDYEAMHAKATEACARSCEIETKDVVDAEWSGTEFSPSSFVAVDRAAGKVVLSVRGTWEFHDALTDVSSESVKFLNGWAHSGMVASAWQVLKRMLPAVARSMRKHSGYEFLVTGHSMGGGVAACVAMLMHSTDKDIESLALEGLSDVVEEERREILRRLASCTCVCIAAPSVSSMDLSEAASDYITCVVAGADVIPRLCHASVRRLLRRLNHAAPSHAMLRAVSSVLGGRDRPALEREVSATEEEITEVAQDLDNVSKDSELASGAGARDVSKAASLSPPKKRGDSRRKCQGAWGEVEGVVGLELRDHAASDFMVQPGRVIHLKHVRSDAPTAEYKHPTAFTDVVLDPYMMLDHIPGTYQAAVKAIHDRVKAGGQSWVEHDASNRDSDDEDEEDAVSAFLHAQDVRSGARRGWRSVRNFLGIDGDEDDDAFKRDAHDAGATAPGPRPSRHVPDIGTDTDDDDSIPDFYGEDARARRTHHPRRASARRRRRRAHRPHRGRRRRQSFHARLGLAQASGRGRRRVVSIESNRIRTSGQRASRSSPPSTRPPSHHASRAPRARPRARGGRAERQGARVHHRRSLVRGSSPSRARAPRSRRIRARHLR